MCAYVVGVVRSATRLDALTYEASEPADPACPWRRAHGYSLRPLPATARPALAAAWRRLERVDRWGQATLDDVLLVLRETVPSVDTPGDLAVVGDEVLPASPPRATAAHPRAYRGTRFKPPRPRQPASTDVRPHLLTRRHTDRVLEQLGCAQHGDAYIAWNHGAAARAGLDPRFVMYLLPLLRGCSGSLVGTAATLAQALDAYTDPELRAALVGLCLAAGDPHRALVWWAHVLAHAPAHRLEVASIVVASEAAKVDPFDASVAAAIAELGPEQQWSLYRAFARGASPAYLLSGLELGAIAAGEVADLPAGGASVTSIVEAAVASIGDAFAEDSGLEFWRPHVWRLCGHLASFAELIASPAFLALEPSAAFWVVRLASTTRWKLETADREWRALAPHLPSWVERAGRLPRSHQRKFIEQLGDVYWWAIDNEHDVAEAIAPCVDLSHRVAGAPFGTKAVLGPVLPFLALLYKGEQSGREALRDAPDASWLAIEQACARGNEVRTLGRGLNRIALHAPTLLVATFVSNPSAVIETADRLASISYEAAELILTAFAKSALAAVASDASIELLCELVAPVARAGGPNPIRRALRAHFTGERTLSEDQLRGHRARIVEALGIIRLAALRQAVDRVLSAKVGIESIETPAVRHALAMLEGVGVHRRQLRRMLAAWLAGDREWTLRHPRTRAWFARHPRLDRDAWLTGITTHVEIDGLGRVEIKVESDPLEALKLGTYVGSCLGRGGNLEYSAAAVVLDVNKQVAYARDARGAVVGRQLLAIAASDELVCFSVYGAARRELEAAFRAFDKALATKLGVELFSGGAAYEIAQVLSHDWFDDSPWSPAAGA